MVIVRRLRVNLRCLQIYSFFLKLICLLVSRFFFSWCSSETPSLNSPLSLSIIETFVQALPPSKFRLITWTDFPAAGTFDSASRGIVTAFTDGIDVKNCRFDSCVVAAAWSDFVSCNFLRIDNVMPPERVL